MERNDIIRMAREVGATPYTNRHYPDRPTHTFNPEQLERFAARVAQEATEKANRRANASWTLMCEKMVAAEREACANVCDAVYHQHIGPNYGEVRYGIAACAAAIRARST
jgi:hypothetical protein